LWRGEHGADGKADYLDNNETAQTAPLLQSDAAPTTSAATIVTGTGGGGGALNPWLATLLLLVGRVYTRRRKN
jgi:MprA protease rhombosortase-interaction domain-containing protein